MPSKLRKAPNNSWSLQDAKAHFSELVRLAETRGAQRITKHGRDSVVVIPSAEYARLQGKKTRPSLLEALLNSPLKGTGIEFERIQGGMREVEFD